ncbi:MAG: hypothetical protein ACK4UJ_07655 [Leptonema sp. (in: bacteria)]
MDFFNKTVEPSNSINLKTEKISRKYQSLFKNRNQSFSRNTPNIKRLFDVTG